MQINDVTDHQLIEQYTSGDKSAIEHLIRRHQQKIYTSIYFLVRNRELAEDLFQETFIKVINTFNNGTYKEEGKFLPWAMRIGHNLVIDYFRKKQRMPMVYDREDYSVVNNLKLHDENAEDKICREQIHNEVRMLIEELPYEQREIIIMRHYADLSFKEIADATNCSINTALGRMRYALINLRKLIKDKNLVVTS